MGTLKKLSFEEVANKSLERVCSEFRDKYTPKKDGRFFIKGITYEIGAAKADHEGISFEISSKIPFEILPRRSSKETYFNKVKNIMIKKKPEPASVEIDSIVTALNQDEQKERDYVKVGYKYKEEDLFSPQAIERDIEEYRKNPKSIPNIPGISTLFGKLILLDVENSIYKYCRRNITLLMEANDTVYNQYSKK